MLEFEIKSAACMAGLAPITIGTDKETNGVCGAHAQRLPLGKFAP
jgi:hypothetical protein